MIELPNTKAKLKRFCLFKGHPRRLDTVDLEPRDRRCLLGWLIRSFDFRFGAVPGVQGPFSFYAVVTLFHWFLQFHFRDCWNLQTLLLHRIGQKHRNQFEVARLELVVVLVVCSFDWKRSLKLGTQKVLSWYLMMENVGRESRFIYTKPSTRGMRRTAQIIPKTAPPVMPGPLPE